MNDLFKTKPEPVAQTFKFKADEIGKFNGSSDDAVAGLFCGIIKFNLKSTVLLSRVS